MILVTPSGVKTPFPLTKDETRIGRSADNDIVIAERAGDELFEQYADYRLRQEADTRRPAHQYKHQRAHWDAVIDQLERSFLEAVRSGRAG